MGVQNSIEKTVKEMPPEEEIRKTWKTQIRKEEKAGLESEYDISDEDISENSKENEEKQSKQPKYEKNSEDTTDKIENISKNRPKDYLIISSDESDSESENKIEQTYDEFGTCLLISRILENISESKNVIVIEKIDKTIHDLLNYLLSYENNGKFVFVTPEKKIGCLIENLTDQRISIITQNSSLETSKEKVIFIAEENIMNFNISEFDMIVFYEVEIAILNLIISKNKNYSGNYIIFTKTRNDEIIRMKNEKLQPCSLIYNKDDINENNKFKIIDFDNCEGMKFETLSELYSSIVYSAAKLGFKIIARDGLSGKKSPVRFSCERSSRKKDEKFQTSKKCNCKW